jgi:hypothetical protein
MGWSEKIEKLPFFLVFHYVIHELSLEGANSDSGFEGKLNAVFISGLTTMDWVEVELMEIDIFLRSSSWLSAWKVIYIFFLDWLTIPTTLVSSWPTFVIPKSMFWSSVFSTSSFRGVPLPWLWLEFYSKCSCRRWGFTGIWSSPWVWTRWELSAHFSQFSKVFPSCSWLHSPSGSTTSPEGIFTSK